MLSFAWFALAVVHDDGGFTYWVDPDLPAGTEPDQFKTLREAINAFKAVLDDVPREERNGELIILRESRAVVMRERNGIKPRVPLCPTAEEVGP